MFWNYKIMTRLKVDGFHLFTPSFRGFFFLSLFVCIYGFGIVIYYKWFEDNAQILIRKKVLYDVLVLGN